MAEQEAAVAVAEPDEAEPPAGAKRGWFGRGKKQEQEDDAPEHELEFATPFGKLELEFEPTTKKEQRDRKKRAQAEQQAAKDDAKNAKQQADAAKQLMTSAKSAAATPSGGGSGKLLVALVVLALIAAVGVAVWLFARKPEELESVPPEYRAIEVEAEPQGFVPKMRHRLRHALREGQQASREAQLEQQQRYEDMTRGS